MRLRLDEITILINALGYYMESGFADDDYVIDNLMEKLKEAELMEELE